MTLVQTGRHTTTSGAIFLAIAAFILGGCSTERDPGDLFAPQTEPTIVVDARLIVGSPLAEVRLTRTLPPNVPYTDDAAAIHDARVEIEVEGEAIAFIESDRPGYYVPADTAVPTVLARTTYELRAVTVDGRIVTATTTTPPEFTVNSWLMLDSATGSPSRSLRTFAELGEGVYDAPENQLVYQTDLLEARFDRVDVPAYQAAVLSLDPDSDFVFDPDFFDEEDFADLERSISSSPLESPNGTMRLPWFAIYFTGRYQIKIYAIDDNWFDLVRSAPDLAGGGGGFGGNAGDGFESPIFNVNGGIGLFGSASVDSVGFRVRRR